MAFSNGENIRAPSVFRMRDGVPELASVGTVPPELPLALRGLPRPSERILAWLESPLRWIEIRERRFGVAPWLCLLLVAGVVSVISFIDIRRWPFGQRVSSMLRPSFIALVGFNVFVASAVFWIMAESEQVRWDNAAAALLVGFGYVALLKTTILETKTGRSIGLAKLYEESLHWINDRIMLTKFERELPLVHYVAYTNTLGKLRSTLRDIYRFARTQQRVDELVVEMDSEIGIRPMLLEKRIYCARKLLESLGWDRCLQLGLASLPENEIVDPERIVSACANYCLDTRKAEQARAFVDGELESLKSWREKDYAVAVEERESSRALAKTKQGLLECDLRWLFIHYGFRIDRIKQTPVAPPDLDEIARLEEPQGRRRRLLRFLRGRWLALVHRLRRRGPRAPVGAPVQITLDWPDGQQSAYPGDLEDVSLGGARVRIPRLYLPRADREGVEIQVHVQAGPLAELTATGVPRHKKVYRHASSYGLEWKRLPADVRDRIEQHLSGTAAAARTLIAIRDTSSDVRRSMGRSSGGEAR